VLLLLLLLLLLFQVDTKPDKPGSDAQLLVVGRIGWAAAVSGVTQLAQQCSRRAATSQASHCQCLGNTRGSTCNIHTLPCIPPN
jgi:hypothetical protein